MKCSKPTPRGRSHNHVGTIMGEDLTWRPGDHQAPNQLLNPAKYPETSHKTFRGRKAIRTNIEVEVEGQDNINLGVEEDPPLEVEEDPHIETLGGTKSTENGMSSSHPAQEPTKIRIDGRKIPGLTTRETTMNQDLKENTIEIRNMI